MCLYFFVFFSETVRWAEFDHRTFGVVGPWLQNNVLPDRDQRQPDLSYCWLRQLLETFLADNHSAVWLSITALA